MKFSHILSPVLVVVVAGCWAGMSMGGEGANIAHRVELTYTTHWGSGIALLPLVTDVFSLSQVLRANIINDTMWTLDTCIGIQVSRCTRGTCNVYRCYPRYCCYWSPCLRTMCTRATQPRAAH